MAVFMYVIMNILFIMSEKTQPFGCAQCRMKMSFSTATIVSGKRLRASHPRRSLK
jgi:hypothetical protein